MVRSASNWRFSAFEIRLRQGESSQNFRKSVKTSGSRFLIINWSLNNTRPMASQSREIRPQSQKSGIQPFDFLNCVTTSGLTAQPATIYDRKAAARRFDTVHDIL